MRKYFYYFHSLKSRSIIQYEDNVLDKIAITIVYQPKTERIPGWQNVILQKKTKKLGEKERERKNITEKNS